MTAINQKRWPPQWWSNFSNYRQEHRWVRNLIRVFITVLILAVVLIVLHLSQTFFNKKEPVQATKAGIGKIVSAVKSVGDSLINCNKNNKQLESTVKELKKENAQLRKQLAQKSDSGRVVQSAPLPPASIDSVSISKNIAAFIEKKIKEQCCTAVKKKRVQKKYHSPAGCSCSYGGKNDRHEY
jgi:hypothetical protein